MKDELGEILEERVIANRKQGMIFVMTVPKFNETQRLNVVNRSFELMRKLDEKRNYVDLMFKKIIS